MPSPQQPALSTLCQHWYQQPLTEGQKALLDALLDQPAQTALTNISQLAKRLEVAPSSLTRLAQKLHYSGFPSFQQAFKQHLGHSSDSSYHQRLANVLSEPADNAAQRTLWHTAQDELANIQHLLDTLDPTHFEQAAAQLAGASKVRIHALRQQHAIGAFIGYGLSMIRPDVALLGNEHLGFTHPLADLTADDLLLVLGCSPHTHSTVIIAQEAAERGIPIIALTDAADSPLARCAETFFVLSTQGHYYINNLASWMMFAEALLTRIAQQLGHKAQQQLDQRVTLYRKLGTYTQELDA